MALALIPDTVGDLFLIRWGWTVFGVTTEHDGVVSMNVMEVDEAMVEQIDEGPAGSMLWVPFVRPCWSGGMFVFVQECVLNVKGAW